MPSAAFVAVATWLPVSSSSSNVNSPSRRSRPESVFMPLMVADAGDAAYTFVNENFEPVPRDSPPASVAKAEIVPSPLSVTVTSTVFSPLSVETPAGESSVAASVTVYSYVLPASAIV